MSEPNNPLDPKCHELAKHFLRGCNGAQPEDVQELAEAVQRLCEDMAGWIAGGEADVE